jgi:hypothetical protein
MPAKRSILAPAQWPAHAYSEAWILWDLIGLACVLMVVDQPAFWVCRYGAQRRKKSFFWHD